MFLREDKQALKNRDFYFGSELTILILTATATVLNLLVASYSSGILSSVAGVAAATATASVTAIIGFREIKNYRETWLRHRDSVQKYRILCHNYAFGGKGYEYFGGRAAVYTNGEEAMQHEIEMYNKFKNGVLELIEARYDEFKKNMKK